MSIAERKRSMEIVVDEIGKTAGVIASCSDQNMETVIELAKHTQAIGAPYIVVHAPVLNFLDKQDETLYQYYKTICEQVDIGVAMWSHQDSGYLMSPELCARIAEIPNIVAIKYSVPREMYVRLTRMVGDKIQVSTASEAEWFDNIVELGWRLYLCSSPPYLLRLCLSLCCSFRGGCRSTSGARKKPSTSSSKLDAGFNSFWMSGLTRALNSARSARSSRTLARRSTIRGSPAVMSATPAVGYLVRMPAISAIRLHFTALSASIRVGAHLSGAANRRPESTAPFPFRLPAPPRRCPYPGRRTALRQKGIRRLH